MATKIQLRRDLAASWTNTNPTLAQGEPGLELDTGKVKYGDGVTAWNSLAYASGGSSSGGSENQWIMLFEDEWPIAVSISLDGLNWTPGFGTTDYTYFTNDIDMYAYRIAAGGSMIAYVVYNYNFDSSDIWYSSTANQAAKQSPSLVVRLGPNGENIQWQKIRYLGGHFIAVGFYYPSTDNPNNWYYPCFVYSSDGINWTWGNVDLTNITNMITNERNNSDSVDGISMEDVSFNGTGWLFGQHYMWNSISDAIPAGAYYVTELSATLSASNLITTIPGTYRDYFDGHGWVCYGGGDNNNLYFNSTTDPTMGTWNIVNADNATATVWPDGNGFETDQDIVNGIAAGTVGAESVALISLHNGRVLKTTNQGQTFTGVVPNPYPVTISSISVGNPTIITISGNNAYYNGEKLTITGADPSNLNGTYYINTNTSALYTDSAMTQGLDSTSWGGSYVTDSGLITWTHGDPLDYLHFGGGTFVGVGDNSPVLYTSTDGVTWNLSLAQYGWEGPWDYKDMAWGEVGSANNLLLSNSSVLPGLTNFLSIADSFNVGLVNGDPNLEEDNFGYGYIQIDPSTNNWHMGTYQYNGCGVEIGSYSYNGYHDINGDLFISTWSNNFYFVDHDNDNNGNTSLRTPYAFDLQNESNESFLRDIPQNSVNGNYTLNYEDRGRHIYCTNPSFVDTIYVPTHTSVNFPIGASIVIVTNGSQGINIVAENNGVTTLIGSGIGLNANGFSLPAYSMATLLQIETNTWMISGTGLAGL